MPSNLREQFNEVRNLQAKACNTAVSSGCLGSIILCSNALSIVYNNSAAPLNVADAVAGLAIIGLGFALGRKYRKQAAAAVEAAVQSEEKPQTPALS